MMSREVEELPIESEDPGELTRTEPLALWAIESNTGWTSVGELLMTRRISAVAVCCSSVSVRSRLRASSSVNRRTFSMAMTAWSAKVLRRATWASENGRVVTHLWTVIAPIVVPSRTIGTESTLLIPASRT